MTRLTISELWIYPVKSAGGISVTEAVVGSRGFEGDRRWMVVDDDGRFVTQREVANMAMISTTLAGAEVTLSAPGMTSLVLSHATVDGGGEVNVRVWNDTCSAVDAGPAAGEWISEAVGRACRLVYMPDTTERIVDEAFSGVGHRVGFADGFPFLVATTGSLSDLNQRLDTPVSMKRFRPNIVIAGAEPFEEDGWGRFSVNGVVFENVKPCSRCSITTVEPETGLVSAEPLRTLSLFRRFESGVMFGQNAICFGPGVVRVGDDVEISTVRHDTL